MTQDASTQTEEQRDVPHAEENSGVFNRVCQGVYRQLCFTALEPTLTLARFQQVVHEHFREQWDTIPDELPPQKPSMTAATQCPMPGTHMWVPFPIPPFPVRCASNTLSTGMRCRLPANYPFTLCETHIEYFKQHKHLPPGGATRPYVPHPDDYWPVRKPTRP